MNNFKKEELIVIRNNLSAEIDRHLNCELYGIYQKLCELIDNYCEHEEKEIYCCHTALAVTDDFFCKQQHLDIDHLIPVIHQLSSQCDGIIKNAGLYKFELRLVKLK
jgi:hypothetical protein